MLNKFIITGMFIILLLPACNKIIDMKPENELDVYAIYTNDHLANSAVVGIYKSLVMDISLFNGQATRSFSLASDDLIKLTSASDDTRFLNLSWRPTDVIISNFWNKGYNYIYHCNSVIINLSKSKALSTPLKVQLEGEAKFLRSLVYLYMINLFDSIPLVLDIDPAVTAKLGRTSPAVIYQHIIADLVEAQELLPEEYPVNSSMPAPITRANKAAASALLARIYLYVKDYEKAEVLSSQVINKGNHSLEKNLDSVFLSSSKETIFALYPTMDKYNTVEGRIFNINPETQKAAFAISPGLLTVFENSDFRYAKWMQNYSSGTTTYKIPYKYKVYQSTDGKITEYNTLIRLAEMYLIRAEANCRQGKLQQAVEDVNTIRKRANVANLSSANQQQIRLAIELENQREFFAEFGHRWFDLRRWEAINNSFRTRADEVLGQSKKQYWAGYKINLPIPADELLRSTSLSQNFGY